MATKYKVTVPPTMEQGSYTTIVSRGYYQTVPQAALQDYNSARAHDGLPPIRRMPAGTKYVRLSSQKPKSGAGWDEIKEDKLIRLSGFR